MKYIIKDWAGNIVDYKGRVERPEFAVAMEFIEFYEAAEYIAEHFENEQEEFYVEEKGE